MLRHVCMWPIMSALAFSASQGLGRSWRGARASLLLRGHLLCDFGQAPGRL